MSLLKILGRPIAFHAAFADITGSVSGGVFLSQALYWTERTSDPHGWFYKSQKEWHEETKLSRYEQETARKKLRELGILQEKQEGTNRTLWFRIDLEKLEELLQKTINVEKPIARKSPFHMRKTSRWKCEKPADGSATFPHMSNITETTTETTTEITSNKKNHEFSHSWLEQKNKEIKRTQEPKRETERLTARFLPYVLDLPPETASGIKEKKNADLLFFLQKKPEQLAKPRRLSDCLEQLIPPAWPLDGKEKYQHPKGAGGERNGTIPEA